MRRLGMLLVAGVVAGLFVSSDAQACHKKKCAEPCAVVAAPCPPEPVVVYVAPAPCPEPAPCEPVCEPAPKKKCGLFGGNGGGLFSCLKKKQSHCEPAPVYTAYTYSAPVYAAPQYAAPQYAAPQH